MSAFHVLRGLDQVPSSLAKCVVAIGNFDGCHLGHQQIIATAKAKAVASGRSAIMLTFEPHPRDVFSPEPFLFRLSDGEQKARLAAALGLDGIVVMPFGPTLAAVEADDFVKSFLRDALDVSEVVVGADFHFGRGREGTPEFLVAAGQKYGFGVQTLELLKNETEIISSSRIREALKSGETAKANRLLGYHWLLEGTVISGDKRGRELGFPTANFALPANSDLAQGVYAVRVKLGNRILDGVAAYGKPMFDNVQPPFEAHIFDFDEDIYGSHIAVTLVAFIRGQIKFDGLDQLITQMSIDSQAAQDILARVNPLSNLDKQLGVII